MAGWLGLGCTGGFGGSKIGSGKKLVKYEWAGHRNITRIFHTFILIFMQDLIKYIFV